MKQNDDCKANTVAAHFRLEVAIETLVSIDGNERRCIALGESGLKREDLTDWGTWLWFALVAILAAAIGLVAGLFPGFIVVVPILAARGKANGAPFNEGDVVQIIAGSHRGTVSKVYSKWQGDSVRVELGPAAADSYSDVFSPTEILRIPSSG